VVLSPEGARLVSDGRAPPDVAPGPPTIDGLRKLLHLSSPIPMQQMWAFNANGRIEQYVRPEDIVRDFVAVRRELYQLRKVHPKLAWCELESCNALLIGCLVQVREEELLRLEAQKLANQVRFLELVGQGELKLGGKSKASLEAELAELQFATGASLRPKTLTKTGAQSDGAEEAEEVDDGKSEKSVGQYGYLLSMPLWSATKERCDKLRAQRAATQNSLQELERTTADAIWLAEIQAFREAVGSFLC